MTKNVMFRERWTTSLLTAALLLGAASRCNCDDEGAFLPGAAYEPLGQMGTLLDFGRVAVSSQKKLDIRVTSTGRAALEVMRASVDPAFERVFLIELGPSLDGLSPGQTSSISVTFRPCPDAWNGNQLNESYDLANCPSTPAVTELNVVDNTPEGGAQITLSGQPAQAPVIEVACAPANDQACGDTSVDLSNVNNCVVLRFGDVTLGSTPCDLVFEIRNKERDGKETGDLNIEKVEIRVQQPGTGNPIVDGKTVGFSILNLDGTPLDVSPDNMLSIPIPQGSNQGIVRLKARFDGSGSGIWRGEQSNDTGIRIYNDDPDNRPVRTFSVFGNGAAPEIIAQPNRLAFGSVPQGTSRTSTITITNLGNADLNISEIRFRDDTGGQKFTFTTSLGQNPPFTLEENGNPSGNGYTFRIFVRYQPISTGEDADVLRISSNDVRHNPLEIPITGGAVPKIELSPSDTLVFALPNPPPPPPVPPRNEDLVVRNVGFGDLIVTGLNIVGPGGSTTHSSVNDFSIVGCSSFPCTPSPEIRLCAPGATGCSSSSTRITIVYDNDDASTTDLVELHVSSNDPIDPERIVVLSAEDVPCLPPTPVITIETNPAIRNQQVFVNASASLPGGAAGAGTTISAYDWDWVFAPSSPAPAIVPEGNGARASFVPTLQGIYVIRLDATNSCGSRSQASDDATIAVSPN